MVLETQNTQRYLRSIVNILQFLYSVHWTASLGTEIRRKNSKPSNAFVMVIVKVTEPYNNKVAILRQNSLQYLPGDEQLHLWYQRAMASSQICPFWRAKKIPDKLVIQTTSVI